MSNAPEETAPGKPRDVPVDVKKIRFERLQLVCRKALEQVIKKSLAVDQIHACYPTLTKSEEGLKSLDTARSQIIKFWHSSSMKEFELIFEERNIKTKLDELDEIIQTAQYRKEHSLETPPKIDKLTPTEIIEATIVSNSSESLENLEIIYNQLCVDNTELYAELQGLSAQSEEIKDDINSLLVNLDKEIQTLGSDRKLDDLIDTLQDVQ